jgi:hypothetical protein
LLVHVILFPEPSGPRGIVKKKDQLKYYEKLEAISQILREKENEPAPCMKELYFI